MFKRTVPATLLALTLATPHLYAQRTNSNLQSGLPPVPGATPNNINPTHERMKSEAEQAYHAGSFDRSIELTSKVIAQNSSDHVAYYLRASARVEKGIQTRTSKLIRDGINDARLAINHGAADPSVAMYYLPYLYGMTNLGMIESRPEHAQVSLQVAQQALANRNLKAPDRANILYQKGLTEAFLKKYDEAARSYSEAVKLVDTHLGAHIGLADAYARAGNASSAKVAYDRAVQTFPSNPLVYNNRGQYLQQTDRLDEAIADFNRALQLDPRFVTAQTNRGFTLMEAGKLTEAEQDFNAALQINANQPTVYSLRGTCRLAQGKTQEAIADYREVVKRDGNNPVAHADLGFALYFVGNHTEARTEFEKAMSLNAAHRYLSPWLYLTMKKQGQEDAARSRFSSDLGKAASRQDWVDHLLQYVAGRTTPQQLLASAAVGNEKTKAAQTCEARFFIGQVGELNGNSDGARTQYQAAIATGQRQLSAFRGSQLALTRQTAQP